jgi:hypothetical protein
MLKDTGATEIRGIAPPAHTIVAGNPARFLRFVTSEDEAQNERQ